MAARFRSMLLVALAAMSAVGTGKCTTFPLNVGVLHEFEYPSWFENLAVRSNGNILTSRLDTPKLYQVDPTTGAAVEVASWNASDYKGALGVAEGAADVFYVILAAFVDEDFVKTSGVNAIYKVDMNGFQASSNGTSVATAAQVSHLTDIHEADFLNGMATLDETHIYVGDVYSGVVYLVDVATGDHHIAVDDALMKWSVNAAAGTNLGCNGLKVHDGHLYWANTAAGFVARVPIGADGFATGASEVVATNVPKADDFQVRADGALFVAQNQQDTLSYAAPATPGNGSVAAFPIAGSNISTILAGVTSAKFGRTSSDSSRLYLATSGGLASAINGSITVAGTISYVDINF